MNRDELLGLYRQMVLIRRLEERAAQLYQEGKIGGFLSDIQVRQSRHQGARIQLVNFFFEMADLRHLLVEM